MTDHDLILDAAIRWHTAGVVAVPVRTDGSKAPGLREWKTYQTTPPSIDNLLTWFGAGHVDGLGVLTGTVSGNLEMLEFEGRAVDAGLLTTLDQHAEDNGMTDLIEKLLAGYCERTPSGGIHLLYRVTGGTVEKNTKLASRPSTPDELTAAPGQKVKVLAETRGEGGFVVTAPSFGRSHPTKRPWTMISGSIDTVPAITADERDQLWALVSLLDQTPVVAPMTEPMTGVFGSTPGTRPGDDYADRTSWDDILTPLGWTRKFRMGNGYAWQRPGKTGPGISATTGQATDGVDRLYVFSSSTEFEPERPYNKFSAFALLHHHGDYAAAATQLVKDGYGTQPTQPIAQAAPPLSPSTTPARHLTVVDGSSALVPDPDPMPAAHTPARSEDGHSQALIAEHGDRLRYCPPMGRWLHWDEHRWHKQPIGGGQAREFAKAVARTYPDGGGWTAHKKRSLSNAGLTACLGMSETDPRITVDIDELDAHPWELNTPGGIINLRTGQLRPPDPAALHTRSTRVAPDLTADQTPWLDFLHTTFRGDHEIIGFIQRLMGYACVGAVREAILPVFYGQGANGKTVLLETVQAILGDYATVAPSKFLVQGPGQHATEIAALAGARLVIASETNEGERFDEAKVKQLTGGDTIKARFMRQDEFTFTPSHLLVMMTNHRPEVGSGGTSFWRRVREVPFTNVIPEPQRDTELKDRLVEQHGPAIMAWLAQGAALYARDGLREPEGVRAATQAYEASTDTVSRFVDDMVILGGGDAVKTRSSAVREAYDAWCRAEGEIAVAPKTLTTQLMGKFDIGMHKGSKGARFLTGMTLAGSATDEPPATTTDPWGGS